MNIALPLPWTTVTQLEKLEEYFVTNAMLLSDLMEDSAILAKAILYLEDNTCY